MTADPTEEHPVLLFDGVCNLCNSAVQFVLERDDDGAFRFASLQSEAGRAILARFDLPVEEFDSVVLVEGDDYYTKSTAALRVCRRLDGLYPLLYAFIVVPRPIRDWMYDVVADNRYDWFGRKDACMMPTPELRERFLDDGVGPTSPLDE